MRKGWFKKAKRKFVKKRVIYWEIKYGFTEIPYLKARKSSITLGYDTIDNYFVLLNEIYEKGFVTGFWAARKLKLKFPNIWKFRFQKRLISNKGGKS